MPLLFINWAAMLRPRSKAPFEQNKLLLIFKLNLFSKSTFVFTRQIYAPHFPAYLFPPFVKAETNSTNN